MVTPAHHTKGAHSLTHSFGQATFVLNQSDDGRANGTSLWLGGQALALYFQSELKRPTPGTTALELGSGIGLTASVCFFSMSTCYAFLLSVVNPG